MPIPWLSDAQKARVKREHPIVDVLARMGIDPPPYWDGTTPYRVRAGALGFPYGRDDSQGVLIAPDQNRWWAFHGGFGGDVLDLVRRTTGTTSLTDAARILDSRQPIPISETTPHADAAPATLGWSERPDPRRTRAERVRWVNAEAWRYLTLPRLADRARGYLRGRGIDVTALEAEVGRPLAGHTPASRTGLVDHLRQRGFGDDEIVDAGWGARRPDQPLRDRYHHRVLLPFRDQHDRIVGVDGPRHHRRRSRQVPQPSADPDLRQVRCAVPAVDTDAGRAGHRDRL